MQLTTTDDTDYLLNVMATRTPMLVRLSDEHGVYRHFNEAWVTFTGRSVGEESGNGWLRFVHADDRDTVAALYREAVAARADVDVQFRLLRRDGTFRWMLERASPWRQADGSFGGLVGACMDVTTLKTPRAGSRSDHRASRLASVLIRLGHDSRVIYASAEVETLFGVAASVMLGKTLVEAKLPDPTNDILQEVVRGEFSGKPLDAGNEIEFSVQSAHGERHLAASAIDDGAQGRLIFIHDITACVEAQTLHQESLQREELSRQKAELAARSRDQFLSVVSHELRSPLNGIQSWTHVLESQIDSSRPIVERALTGIKTGVTQQVTLIEALLDATQILNGHFSIQPLPYSLNGAIQAALDSLRTEATQKEIDITFTPEFSDIDMVGDVERVQQVIRQLLSNAIKFTQDGGNVRIDVAREEKTAIISVRDNGAGISPGFVSSVFEPFRQVDSSQTRRAAGLGLGLAVSRRIVEMHGGSLQCESEGAGHGSTFRVYLPLPY